MAESSGILVFVTLFVDQAKLLDDVVMEELRRGDKLTGVGAAFESSRGKCVRES